MLPMSFGYVGGVTRGSEFPIRSLMAEPLSLQVRSRPNSWIVRRNSISADRDTRGAPSCMRAQAPASNIHAATTTTFPGSAST
jgi:hypothetical protein